jgi:16S rRNA (guanine527-N7)-methyltransferase
MNNKIKEIFDKYSINTNEEVFNNFDKFLTLFKEKNAITNLSAIRDDEGIILKHFTDSLIVSHFECLQ